MDRIFEANVSVTPPTYRGVLGYPRDDGGAGVPGTVPGAWTFYMLIEELRGLVAGAGLTPDSHSITQVLAAVNALVATGLAGLVSVTSGTPGKITINSTPKFQIEWFLHNNVADDETVTFPFAFPTACRGVIPVVVGANSSSTVNPQTNTYTTTSCGLHAELQERSPNVTGVLLIAFGN